ncbi:hypothetical protein, partial [Pseudomonas viridiflava]|uniref:hypothetical protein n=1 Tax=Pseudomonas viridiflava TaxID=33069 RepID=UPI0019D0264F
LMCGEQLRLGRRVQLRKQRIVLRVQYFIQFGIRRLGTSNNIRIGYFVDITVAVSERSTVKLRIHNPANNAFDKANDTI